MCLFVIKTSSGDTSQSVGMRSSIFPGEMSINYGFLTVGGCGVRGNVRDANSQSLISPGN